MMAPSLFLDGRVVLHAGDCIDVLRDLPDDSLDACVTDPPYHLTSIVKRFGAPDAALCKVGKTGAYARASRGFMGQSWDGGDIAFRSELWREVLRVLKPGGHLVAFSGTRTQHRMVSAIDDAGFEIRDGLAWVYGSGFPKSHDVSKGIDKVAGHFRGSEYQPNYGNNTFGRGMGGGKHGAVSEPPVTSAARQWEGWGTALKPALEPICLARKPLSEGTVAANVLRWGTGALNIDGCRVEGEGVLRSTGNGTRLRQDGYGMQGGVIGGSELGRFPANFIHDGSPEVLAGFPDSGGAHGGGRRLTRSEYRGGGEADASAVPPSRGDTGSAARFFYSAKADANDRIGSAHPTVKPVDLMRWLVRLVTPTGGAVLDFFAGTGTTGEAAWREGFSAVLVEREAAYRDDIARRMALCLAGPATRRVESRKARAGHAKPDHGPLFAEAVE